LAIDSLMLGFDTISCSNFQPSAAGGRADMRELEIKLSLEPRVFGAELCTKTSN
jgi:hypothetical protein